MDLYRDRDLTGATPSHTAAAEWALDELRFVRREAQQEADLAYQDWSRHPGRDGHAVYRAAQDRADAAQNELAAWMCDPCRGGEPCVRCRRSVGS